MTEMRLASTAVVLIALAAAPAPGQPGQPAPSATAAPGAAERALASRFELFAREQASPLAKPTDDQLIVADVLLALANELDGASPERWHMAARVADALDQPDAARRAIKRYIRLVPDDDVAQLRLVQMVAQGKQTVDDRLAFFLRIAEGALAKRFTPALRSRLAHAAATLQREQGRADEHRRLLGLALKLDPTNHAAAAEAYATLSADAGASVTERAAALFTLFNAKPTDPMTHLAIADTLMAFGQYDRALTWYTTANQLLRAHGGGADLSIVQAIAMALWGAGRTDDAIRQLKSIDALPATSTQPAGDDSEADGGAAEADDAAPIEMLMLLGAMVVTSPEPTDGAALHGRIERRLIAAMRTDESAAPAARLVWAHLLFERSLAAVPALIERIEKAEGDQPLLRGWLAVRQGDRDTAEELLGPLADHDGRAALGLAEALADAQQPEPVKRRRDLLARVATGAPDDIFGLIAVARLRAMGVGPPSPAGGSAIDKLFEKVPLSLQRMHADPLAYVSMHLRAAEARFGPGEPIEVEIEIRNTSPLVLSLGDDGVVPARLLLTPTVTVGRAGPIAGAALIDVARRLRIGAQRSVTLKARLDTIPAIGRQLARSPDQRAQIDVVGVLNPVYTQRGVLVAGLLGAQSQVRNIARPTTPLDDETLAAMVGAIGGVDKPASVRALSVLLPLAARDDLLPGQQQAVADAAARLDDAYDTLTPAERAYALTCLPSAEIAAAHFGRFVERAQRDADTRVRIGAVLALADGPDHPLVSAAVRGNDPTVKRFGQAYKAVLTPAKPTE